MTPEEQAAREAFFQHHTYSDFPWWVMPLVAFVAAVLFVITAWIAFRAHNSRLNRKKVLANWLVGACTLVPPIWFFAEYLIISHRLSAHLPDIEAFKYTASWRKLTKQWNQAVGIDVDPATP
jgi:hypothetical protein